jgi:hypothetical protein
MRLPDVPEVPDILSRAGRVCRYNLASLVRIGKLPSWTPELSPCDKFSPRWFDSRVLFAGAVDGVQQSPAGKSHSCRTFIAVAIAARLLL